MAVQPQSLASLAFGPFQLDSEGGALRRNGVRVRLSGQPFRILPVLLAHPGELVSREQLREEVWTKEDFVDFERGLNAAVNKLRRALGDAAENPRYIETHPGRGYRFVGTIQNHRPVTGPFVAESRFAKIRLRAEELVLGGGWQQAAPAWSRLLSDGGCTAQCPRRLRGGFPSSPVMPGYPPLPPFRPMASCCATPQTAARTADRTFISSRLHEASLSA